MTNTKQRVIDAGVALLRDEGLHAVTVSQCARAAKTSRQTVHKYFETADALREIVMRDGLALGDAKIKARLEIDGLA